MVLQLLYWMPCTRFSSHTLWDSYEEQQKIYTENLKEFCPLHCLLIKYKSQYFAADILYCGLYTDISSYSKLAYMFRSETPCWTCCVPYQPQYSRFCLPFISFCLSIYPFIPASAVSLSHSLQTLYTANYLLPKHEVEQWTLHGTNQDQHISSLILGWRTLYGP